MEHKTDRFELNVIYIVFKKERERDRQRQKQRNKEAETNRINSAICLVLINDYYKKFLVDVIDI